MGGEIGLEQWWTRVSRKGWMTVAIEALFAGTGEKREDLTALVR